MNGIDRNFGVAGKHLTWLRAAHRQKHIKITFTFISLIILLAISSIALVANAQEETGLATATTAVAADAKESTTETATEETPVVNTINARGELSQRAQERIRNLAANMSNRMEAVIMRLDRISERVDSRLMATSKERPEVDLAEATARLETARNNLQQAKATLSNIDEQVNDTVGSETPQSAWLQTKASYQTAKVQIVTAHRSLKQAVAAIRQALTGKTAEPQGSADNTEETETETEEINS